MKQNNYAKKFYNLQKYLQFTSSLTIAGCKNYQILKKRNRLIQIVFTLYLNLPFPEFFTTVYVRL